MTSFLDLWRDTRFDTDILRLVDTRSERFPAVVGEHPGLRVWCPGEGVPPDRPRLLVGVATWSGYDMLLLDLLARNRKPAGSPDPGANVDVFDVAACHSDEDFQQYVPGLRAVAQTPVVGVWVNGRHADSETGAAARNLIAKYTAFDLTEFDRRVPSLHQRTA